jgi:pyrimidine-specific ribonucleoside hydrolase
MREVILDVDTGVDDALAIVFAVAHPAIHLRGISCVAGNVSLPMVVQNTLKVLDLADAPDIPVAAGAHRPLLAQARDASHVHGSDGLADLGLPTSARAVSALSSPQMMREQILASPTPVTIIALGPLTNIALLLRLYPEVSDNLDGILFMGGSAGVGNATAVAEFNIWHDPEAASMVLGSGVPLTMYGLDVFTLVFVDEAIADSLKWSDTARHRFIGSLLHHRVAESAAPAAPYRGLLGDAGAVCAFVDPDAIGWERWPVHIELLGESRGQTIVDRRGIPGEDQIHGLKDPWPVVTVALGVDVSRVSELFLTTVGFGTAGD